MALSRLLWGLVFCCIGDVYLVFESFFIFEVISFGIGQLIYFNLFGGTLSLFLEVDSTEVLAGVMIGIISALIYLSSLLSFQRHL